MGEVLLGITAVGLLCYGAYEAGKYVGGKIKEARNASSTPASPNPFDPKDPSRWNKNSTQVTSKTLYENKGIRLDVENPNPTQRPGQLHVQKVGETVKYYYNNVMQQFYVEGTTELAPQWVQGLLNDAKFMTKIKYGLEILGL